MERGRDPSCKGFKTLSVLQLMRGSGEESWSAVLRSATGGRGSLKADRCRSLPPRRDIEPMWPWVTR